MRDQSPSHMVDRKHHSQNKVLSLVVQRMTADSSLDANGTEELMKLLHMLEGVNIFVISHKGDILQDKFVNTIRFDKIKNFSRIVK